MLHDPDFPKELDHESRMLASSFLSPIFGAAIGWTELAETLTERGYRLAFRDGRLVVVDLISGHAFCTGTDLGYPLRALSDRLGRPRLRMDADGRTAVLV